MDVSPLSVPTPVLQRRPPPIWSYLIADLRTNRILDEIPLADVKWGTKLNDSGAMSGTWQLGPAEKRDAYTLTTPAKTALYAVRDRVPMWGGVLWTRAYDSSTGQLKVGAGDWWSYFDHRKVLPVLAGVAGDTHYVAGQQVSYTATDQNDIARALVQLAQAHTGGDIGIEFDTTLSGTPRDRTYYGYELSSLGDMLRQLCNVEDGPDMHFTVAQGSTDQPRRVLRLGDPWLGEQGSAHVWEYGGNVVNFTWPSDGSKMATRTFATGDGIEKAALIAWAEDSDRYNAGWTLLETEAGYTTVTDDATLNGHATSDLNAARLPVALPTLTVRGDMEPFLGEFVVGDDGRLVVPEEMEDPFFRNGLDTWVRVVAMDVTPEGNDGETVTLTTPPLFDDVV